MCGFFPSRNQWKGKKKCYLVRHGYGRTECCTNCHCLSARIKTALLFPGLIAPFHRIHVKYTVLYFWIQWVRYWLLCVKTLVNFLGNICFSKQAITYTEFHDWLKLNWEYNIPLLSLRLFITVCNVDFLASPDHALIIQDGWGEEDYNNSYLGSYCSTHVMCNLPDPQRLE